MLKNYTKIEVDEYGNKRYLNDEGKLHRLDGPAVEYYNSGSKEWYINGNRHQNIDPVAEYSIGTKYWLFKGRLHRVGGSYSSRIKEYWYINNKEYAKQDYFNIVWGI